MSPQSNHLARQETGREVPEGIPNTYLETEQLPDEQPNHAQSKAGKYQAFLPSVPKKKRGINRHLLGSFDCVIGSTMPNVLPNSHGDVLTDKKP